ncbi:hypothetical protein Focb16_v005862 [Fusarium oxysporum f. sp. cubense]|uniref:Uncharacterized protein n=2 Tax=Fusarium oxysporum f. sp. cubense TaxID=61366 RepID=N4U9G2_FUSC1|nr:hypothetical protein FOC1_g10000942 [Fusarium oxysporum f. sp. cubense race 1]TVY74372.1 hypothetical protein Focb16_v006183 [Fusarium oxysporum f. sp. cubense]TVY75015.1 hypothetical protein Focb16_v005862 [Fusarium oxysporum f. sp. cubense]
MQPYKNAGGETPSYHQRRTRTREIPSPECFLDDEILHGPPSYSKSDFSKPKLRKCRFDVADINWDISSPIDGGFDGYSWKVFFGRNGPYVLKMFWDVEHTEQYFAPERECQNAAILAMMEESVCQATVKSTKIHLNPNPKSKEEASANFYAFTEESLHLQSQNAQVFGISSIPRMRVCYGWAKVGRDHVPLNSWPRKLKFGKKDRYMSVEQEHIAIIYEYIEDKTNDQGTVEKVATFLWQAGFTFTNYPEKGNWRDGVLVDLSEVVHVHGYGWKEKLFKQRDSTTLLA